ncbi:hypothetical protein DICA0_A00364 [Diutina catenulata]
MEDGEVTTSSHRYCPECTEFTFTTTQVGSDDATTVETYAAQVTLVDDQLTTSTAILGDVESDILQELEEQFAKVPSKLVTTTNSEGERVVSAVGASLTDVKGGSEGASMTSAAVEPVGESGIETASSLVTDNIANRFNLSKVLVIFPIFSLIFL